MNILHVVNIYFVLPYFIGNQFDYFHNKGYHMHVVCSPSEWLPAFAEQHHFQYLETPVERSICVWKDLLSLCRICRYIRQQHMDVVVGHTPKGALLAMLAARICGVPKRIFFRHGLVYETSHGWKRRILIWVDRLTSLCATQIICVSPSLLQQSIADRLAPKEKQSLLCQGTCNGVDTVEQFNPALMDSQRLSALREQLGIQPSDFVVGYSGRIVQDKGIKELVQAFDLLTVPNKKLLLVGMFEQRDALPESLQQRILLDPNIIYTGYIRWDMAYYYALMNVYVLASYREGFPTGVLEAQSMEIPVVTTQATGCKDSIIDGQTGLFTTHDPKQMAQQIMAVSHNPLLGKQGRQWVMAHFDSHKIWESIEKLYV